MQAWRVGEERAETYLRLLAEVELRRAGDQLRGLDAAAGTDAWSEPGMEHATAELALWKVIRAGRILVAAGALDHDCLTGFADDLHAAIKARSRLLLNHDRRRGMLHRTMFAPPASPAMPSRPFSWAMRVTPIGRALRVASGRALAVLHLMSLVRIGTEAVITVVMRMHRPPPGTDLEFTRAGPHQLPYDQLWAADEQGTRYTVRFEGPGKGGMLTWRGIARLSPVPPRGARWLDLVGDGTRLIQLPLRTSAARGYPATPPAAEPAAVPPGERLLMLEAERILASADARGPARALSPERSSRCSPRRARSPGSPVPGQLAALCHRLGAAGHGITVPPAAQIPAQWASVLARRDVPVPAKGPEVFAPLPCILPDVDGARFALAGLSMAAGESHLHVVSSGMPWLADRFAHDWTPGFSWWLGDGAGNWHVATAGEPSTLGDGTQAFRLRLTPPLAAVPDAAEVVVTGPATRVRATVRIPPAPGTSED